MFLTAQAFLLILALGGFEAPTWAKAIGGFVGFVFGFMSIQGFERNRAMEIADAELLLDIEKYLILRGYKGFKTHDKLRNYKYLNGKSVLSKLEAKKVMTFLGRGISYDLWKSGMWLISIVSFVLFFYNVFIFSFSSSNGKFLWYQNFAVFKDSLDWSAFGAVFVIFAINWLLFMIEKIRGQQTKRPHLVKSRLPNAFSKKKMNLIRASKRIQLNSIISEIIIILLASAYSLLAYYDLTKFIPYMWLIIMISCLVIMGLSYKKAISYILKTLKKRLKSVA
jgi:hypothetical protein